VRTKEMAGTTTNEPHRRLTLAYSPCPNDTFIFYGIASGRLTLDGAAFDIAHEDVETLNRAALKGTFDITKLSCHAYLLVRDRYHLLSAGAALGYGCGPILVAREPIDPRSLGAHRVAVPGELTTAHLLLRLFAPEAGDKVFWRYDRIIDGVKAGEADCGVIIHEDRFVYEAAGLHKVADLGEWWEQETGAPIPLGCIAMRRELADLYAEAFDRLVQQSIGMARRDRAAALPYIRSHAQQMAGDVLDKHIAMFVNNSSVDLGEPGRAAVSKLEKLARQAGVIS
jgi:1,4-dihydroxy-6-naphthoate synthase